MRESTCVNRFPYEKSTLSHNQQHAIAKTLQMSLARYALSAKADRSTRVCSLYPTFVPFSDNLGNKSKKKETKARKTFVHHPAFVPFIPRLFPFWSIWETKARKKKQKQERRPRTTLLKRKGRSSRNARFGIIRTLCYLI